MKDFDFIIALHALAKAAGCLRPLSIAIQQVGLDVLKAVSGVLDVMAYSRSTEMTPSALSHSSSLPWGLQNFFEIAVKKQRTV